MGSCLPLSNSGLVLVCIYLTLYVVLGLVQTVEAKHLSAGLPGVCETVIRRNQTYEASYVATAIIRKTHACGFLDWGTCSYYTLEPRRFYRTQYKLIGKISYTCCSGWKEVDGECIIIPQMDPSSNSDNSHYSSYESSDPCSEGLAECKARNYSSCAPDEDSALSYICKDCGFGLIDTGDSCVDLHHANKTLGPMDSSDSPSRPYLIPLIVVMVCLVIIIVVLMIVWVKYRHKMEGTLNALKKKADANDKEKQNCPAGKKLGDTLDANCNAEARKGSTANVYADLEVYLTPTRQMVDRYTQLRPQSQEMNSLENRPPLMAPTLLPPSEGKYEYVTSQIKLNSLKPPSSPKPGRSSPKISPRPSPKPSPKPKLKPSPAPMFKKPIRNGVDSDGYEKPQEANMYEEPKEVLDSLPYEEPNVQRDSQYEEPNVKKYSGPYVDMEGDINADDYDLVGTVSEPYVDMNRGSCADIYEATCPVVYEPMDGPDATRASYLSMIP